MKHLTMLLFLGISILLGSCTGPNMFNHAYVEIGMEEETGLGSLGGPEKKSIVINDAGGEMIPERFLSFKGEEKRQQNLAIARRELDTAIINNDFKKANQLQFVIERLNYYGQGGYGGSGRYLVPTQATNKPIIPIIVVNNSTRVIRLSRPMALRGIELGPGEQTPIALPIPMGLNKIYYTEYELGKNRSRNRRVNVYVQTSTKKLVISDI